jgi:deazaflavin-dependent oxidoreductase (nitroreductase family)
MIHGRMHDEIGEELALWGKVAMLETRGRVSGRFVQTAVGYVEQTDGSIFVAAGSDDADWALNLRAEPWCRVRIGDDIGEYEAGELSEADRNRAISALILKYGTPAERLGRGPAFRLLRRAKGDQGGRRDTE